MKKHEDKDLKVEITHQQDLLKKLRQSILQEAIEGKLTAGWREQNPDVEPASELLKRIQAEKEQLVKENKFEIKDRYKPIYYALLHFMGSKYEMERKKMGPELKETVDEIIDTIIKLQEDYG